MNTRKHTLAYRAGALALFAIDCWLPSKFPLCLPLAMITFWLCASFALALAIAPVRSRFSL